MFVTFAAVCIPAMIVTPPPLAALNAITSQHSSSHCFLVYLVLPMNSLLSALFPDDHKTICGFQLPLIYLQIGHPGPARPGPMSGSDHLNRTTDQPD
jgi:hypothetical protein